MARGVIVQYINRRGKRRLPLFARIADGRFCSVCGYNTKGKKAIGEEEVGDDCPLGLDKIHY